LPSVIQEEVLFYIETHELSTGLIHDIKMCESIAQA